MPRPRPIPIDEVAVRIRRHPFVRLALNSSFSALWVGQLISLFGDRIHQIALAFLVFALTNSPVAVAFVFVFASLPNLFLSPIAGTFVDRWDQKDVMVVSDLLRAAIILVIPIAAVTNIFLVYPLIFAVTSVSIFFRPARIAALPRIVREDELLTANSAMWVGETIADVIGYPLAAVFVGFLGPSLPLAFWVDAATYGASAVLIASIYVPPLRDAATAVRRAPDRPGRHEGGLSVPAGRDRAAGQHPPGGGRPADDRRPDRADPALCEGHRGGNVGRREGRLRVPGGRHRRRQPHRRVRHRRHRHASRPRQDRDRRIRDVGGLRGAAGADGQPRRSPSG